MLSKQRVCFLLIFNLLSAFVYAQMPSCSAAAKFYSKDSINIATFGASTVQGVNGLSFQKYLQQNFEYCYVGKVITVTNNGIGGETSVQARPRFATAVEGRTGFVLILIGANDAQMITQRKMRLSETEAAMRYFIEESIKRNLIPVVGTIQFFNDKGNQYLKTCNLYVKAINNLYKKLARDYGIYLADINSIIGRDVNLYQDAIHPNDRGFKLISFAWFDTVNQAIEDKLLLIGLNQNYPNPVRSDTRIGFSLSQAGHVQIGLYNMTGARVKSIFDEYQSSGYHETVASLTDLTPGMYIYVMQVGGQQLSKKLLLIR